MDNPITIQKLDKIIDLLSSVAFSPSAQIENPYKEFAVTIANNATIPIYYAHNYFRMVTATSTTGVTIRFGNAGTFTTLAGAGMGIQHPKIVDLVEIANASGGSITITVGLCVGQVDDNRLNVSGNVSVVNATGTDLAVRDTSDQIASATNVTVTTTAASVVALNTLRMETWITNLDASNTVYLGDSAVNGTTESGIPLLPGATAILRSNAAISGIVTSGTASVAVCTFAYT